MVESSAWQGERSPATSWMSRYVSGFALIYAASIWANRVLISVRGSQGDRARGTSACCGDGGGWASASYQIMAIRDVFKEKKK